MSMSKVSHGEDVQSLITKLKNLDVSRIAEDEAAKIEALTLARKVTATLVDPINRATDLMFNPYSSVAARIAVDLDLFDHIAKSGDTITSAELASASGGDALTISRVLRLLAAIDFVENPALDTWAANATTHAMTSPPIAAGHRVIYDVHINSAMKAPRFFRETKYRVPSEPTDGLIQYANQTKHMVYDYLQTVPSLFTDFNLFMGSTMGAREYWYDWYDVQGRLLQGFDPSECSALLVDLGGGKGHDLAAFDAAFGASNDASGGDLILQELPPVLDSIEEGQLSPKIKKVPHDFFDEQPIKGARGYFFHHVMHDWSDKYCLQILKSVHAAMRPGYSKLLLHQLILPDFGANEMQARYDLVLMTHNSGMERSKTQWTKLLEEVGFVNIQFFEHFDHDGIIEAEISEIFK